MKSQTFEQLRVPIAVGLVLVALFVFWPRDADGGSPLSAETQSPGIVVGEPVGGVIVDSTPPATPGATPIPTVTAAATATPEVTPDPGPDTFTAEVLACRDIDGSRCRGELDEFPRRASSFTALVRFTDARAGDTISVRLTGDGVTIEGGPFTLGGGGDGYYYSRINYGGELPHGEYPLLATRNGTEVARTQLRNG
jgi:hypothetical protein